MAERSSRLGRKPKRLYVRLVRYRETDGEDAPGPKERDRTAAALDAAGRLVAAGELTRPKGDLLIFRAEDRVKAEWLLRGDPLRKRGDVDYQILDWRTERIGAGVNIEPPPSRGSGRLTQVQSVAVVVRDRGRAIEWYRDVLGLLVLDDDPESGYVQLGLGAGSTALSLVVPKKEWGEPLFSETLRRVGVTTGIIFRTDSVRALQLRLEHAGARITQAASHEPWGRNVIRFTDPDGNEFLAFEPAEAPPDGASDDHAEPAAGPR
ncbi:MAG TPA: VOC family protein [Thermoplasmata archaeon]|nr:VOC family protein [Thermoplasmata archaeon]